jgi:hypothetical protein
MPMETSSKETIRPQAFNDPELGSNAPDKARSKVVLPEPLCPTSPSLSPPLREKLT